MVHSSYTALSLLLHCILYIGGKKVDFNCVLRVNTMIIITSSGDFFKVLNWAILKPIAVNENTPLLRNALQILLSLVSSNLPLKT